MRSEEAEGGEAEAQNRLESERRKGRRRQVVGRLGEDGGGNSRARARGGAEALLIGKASRSQFRDVCRSIWQPRGITISVTMSGTGPSWPPSMPSRV